MTNQVRTISTNILHNDCALFHALNNDEMEKIASIARRKDMESHQYLFHQHSPANRVYNVIDGTVMVERTSSSGRRQILGFLFPGDFIGLTHSNYFEYSVKSLSKAQLCEFQREQLFALSEKLPNLKSNVEQISANVLARALDQIYILGQKKAHERLCFLFIQMLERMPGAIPQQINLPMTRQDIADYLGLTIETVSRSFAKLKQEGLIATPSPQRLQILDLEQTELLASAE
ncbi:MAG: Crp/Fnr family transcriptional regulator [Pseudomonadales bacterium]|nr:Crp/Fnr family transcriptional regulator [Pseudomonadales bacterium]